MTKAFNLSLPTLFFASLPFLLFLVAPTQANERSIVISLEGTGVPVDATTLDLFDQLPPQVQDNIINSAACFEIPMYNLSNKKRLGTGIDCLAHFNFTDETIPELTLTDTVILQFHSGTLVATADVTVQQNLTGDPTVTHLTGAFPVEDNIDFASGRFGYYDGGTVRLSGGVDMAAFVASGDPIGFNCIFVINFN